jgi:hypothetical protein
MHTNIVREHLYYAFKTIITHIKIAWTSICDHNDYHKKYIYHKAISKFNKIHISINIIYNIILIINILIGREGWEILNF